MSAVRISGTISKDSRPENGLEDIAEKIATDEFAQHVCIVVFEYHTSQKPRGEAPVPTVRAVAIEPLDGERRASAMQLMNDARRARGRSALSGTLFDPSGDDETDGGDQGEPEDDGPTTSRPVDDWLDPEPAPEAKRSRKR